MQAAADDQSPHSADGETKAQRSEQNPLRLQSLEEISRPHPQIFISFSGVLTAAQFGDVCLREESWAKGSFGWRSWDQQQ